MGSKYYPRMSIFRYKTASRDREMGQTMDQYGLAGYAWDSGGDFILRKLKWIFWWGVRSGAWTSFSRNLNRCNQLEIVDDVFLLSFFWCPFFPFLSFFRVELQKRAFNPRRHRSRVFLGFKWHRFSSAILPREDAQSVCVAENTERVCRPHRVSRLPFVHVSQCQKHLEPGTQLDSGLERV